MIAGIAGALGIILVGLSMALTQQDSRAESHRRARRTARIRRGAGLAFLVCIAVFFGYELYRLRETCMTGTPSGRLVMSVEGVQFDRLFAIHGVLVAGIALATAATVLRCAAPFCSTDSAIGFIALLGGISSGVAIWSSYPASMYGRGADACLIYAYLVGGPLLNVLVVASFFLLLRRQPRPCADDLVQSPRCVQCGYNLTGNISGTCPECGSIAGEHPPFAPTPTAPVEGAVREWPVAVPWACYAFALFSLGVEFAPWFPPLGHALGRCRVLEIQVRIPGWLSYLPRWAELGLTLGLAAMIAMGARGLRTRRPWAGWFYCIWVTATVLLSACEGLKVLPYFYYGVRPGTHTDALWLRVMLAKNLFRTGFPVFMGLWLLQPHVRRRLHLWSTERG
jgi:hypothetical protein